MSTQIAITRSNESEKIEAKRRAVVNAELSSIASFPDKEAAVTALGGIIDGLRFYTQAKSNKISALNIATDYVASLNGKRQRLNEALVDFVAENLFKIPNKELLQSKIEEFRQWRYQTFALEPQLRSILRAGKEDELFKKEMEMFIVDLSYPAIDHAQSAELFNRFANDDKAAEDKILRVMVDNWAKAPLFNKSKEIAQIFKKQEDALDGTTQLASNLWKDVKKADTFAKGADEERWKAKQEIAKHEGKENHLKGIIKGLEHEIADLKKQGAPQEKITELERLNKNYIDQIQQGHKDIDALTTKYKAEVEQRHTIQTEKIRVLEEKSKLEEQVSALSSKISEAQQKMDAEISDKKKIGDNLAKISKQLAEKEGETEKLQKQLSGETSKPRADPKIIGELRQKISDYEKNIGELEKQLAEGKNKFDDAARQAETIQKQYNNLNEDIAAKQKEIQQKNKERSTLDTKVNELAATVQAIASERDGIRGKYQALAKESGELKEKLGASQKQYEASKQNLDTLAEELKQTRESLKRVGSEKATSEEENKKILSLKQELEKKTTQLSGQIETLSKDVEAAKENSDRFEHRHKLVENEKKALEQNFNKEKQVSALKDKAMTELIDASKQANAKYGTLYAKCETLQKQISGTLDSVNEKETALMRKEGSIKNLEAAIGELKKQISDKDELHKQELQTLEQKYASEAKTLQNKINIADHNLRVKGTTIGRLSRELNEEKSNLASRYNAEIIELERKHGAELRKFQDELKQSLRKYELQLNAAVVLNKDNERMGKKINMLKSRLFALNLLLERSRKGELGAKHDINVIEVETKSKIASIGSELGELAQKYNALVQTAKQHEQKEAEFAKTKKDISKLEHELLVTSFQNKDYAFANTQFKNKLEKTKQELAALNTELEIYKSLNPLVEKELAETTKKLNETKEYIDSLENAAERNKQLLSSEKITSALLEELLQAYGAKLADYKEQSGQQQHKIQVQQFGINDREFAIKTLKSELTNHELNEAKREKEIAAKEEVIAGKEEEIKNLNNTLRQDEAQHASELNALKTGYLGERQTLEKQIAEKESIVAQVRQESDSKIKEYASRVTSLNLHLDKTAEEISACKAKESIGELKKKGDAFYDMRDYSHAFDCFSRALSQNPDGLLKSKLLHNLGAIHAENHDYKNAVDCLDKSYAISRHPVTGKLLENFRKLVKIS